MTTGRCHPIKWFDVLKGYGFIPKQPAERKRPLLGSGANSKTQVADELDAIFQDAPFGPADAVAGAPALSTRSPSLMSATVTDKHDLFGDRMKAYEAVETDRILDASLPIYARIDGRSFSAFTRGMQRPFDERMTGAM